MLIIGLTGGIGTGKSTASKLFAKKDIPIVDADVIARQVVLPGTSAYKKIVQHFEKITPDLLLEDGSLNRPALGRTIFGNEAERKFLNSVVHPAIRWEMFKQVVFAWIKGSSMVVMDVPLLYESKLDRFCATSVVVVCDEETEYARLRARDPHLTEQDAKQRIASQMSLDDKRLRADYVLENNTTIEELSNQVDILVDRISPARITYLTQWLVPPVGLIAALIAYIQRSRRSTKAKL